MLGTPPRRALVVAAGALLAALARAQDTRLVVEVVGPDGTPAGAASIHVWDVAGQERRPSRRVRWRPGASRQTFAVATQEVDVEVSARDYDAWCRGGLAPAALPREGQDRVLRVALTPRPRLRGVVRRPDGVDVAADVWCEVLPRFGALARQRRFVLRPDEPSGWRVPGLNGVAAPCGFDLPVPRRGEWFLVRACAPDHGFVTRGPFHADDPEVWREPLALVVDEPFASIEGRLLVPDGVAAADLLIGEGSTGVWWPVAPDGRFEVRALTAGPHALQLLDWPEREDEDSQWLDPSEELAQQVAEPPRRGEPEAPPAGTSGRRVGVPLFVSDAGPLPPDWHVARATLPVELAPGERRAVTFDARGPAPCRLEGRLTLPMPVPSRRAEGMAEGGEGPRVTLDRADLPGYAARADLAPDGTFLLAVFEPGRYRLRVDLLLEGGPGPVLEVWVDLAPGTRRWEATVPAPDARRERAEPDR